MMAKDRKKPIITIIAQETILPTTTAEKILNQDIIHSFEYQHEFSHSSTSMSIRKDQLEKIFFKT